MPPSSPSQRRLIVNADDFGISPGVNAGIVDAHRHGLVTGASLMANLPSADDALTRAAACPELRLGLHLTLTTGRPLSRPEAVGTLVDADGCFFVLGELLARLWLGKVRSDHLERELDAQIAWAFARGIRPDHLDSHHHVHTHPRVAGPVVALAKRHGIRYVRSPAEGLAPNGLWSTRPREAARTAAISLFGTFLRPRLRQCGLTTSEHFRGIELGLGFSAPALLRTLRGLPNGLTELMTHPGRPDAELARRTGYVAGRDRELAALTAPEIVGFVRAARIELSGFDGPADARAYT